jgi:exopolysaccharide biosynthesis polyprenyl glycosylphosphotransferase
MQIAGATPILSKRFEMQNRVVAHNFYATADLVIAGTLTVAAFAVAHLDSPPQGIEPFLKLPISVGTTIVIAFFLLAWHVLLRMAGVYKETHLPSLRHQMGRLVLASSLASLLLLVISTTGASSAGNPFLVPLFWMLAITAMASLRVLIGPYKPARATPRELIIVGSGPRALSLCEEIRKAHKQSYRVLGFVDSTNGHRVAEEAKREMLGSLEDLDMILMKRVVDRVIIALPIKSCYEEIRRTVAVCERAGVESEYVSELFDLSIAHPQHGVFESHEVVRFKVVKDDYRLYVKRLIDIVGALVGLVGLAPLMLIVSLAIKVTSPGPVLFIHERHGLGKRRFVMYKFRTMVANAEALKESVEHLNEAQGPVFKIRRDPRITPLGRFLRKASLDELPQLFNVLRGDMSLVGPRPLIGRDVALFQDPGLMRRFSVKPGLTGLWQVSGRSDLSFDRWIELDLQYIDTWSLGLDLTILFRTVPTVIRGHGAA